MNIFRISAFCILLMSIVGCTHSLTREDKKVLAKTARAAVTMFFVGVGAGGGGAMGMDNGDAGAIALGVGGGISLRQGVALNLDRREEELRQSKSAKRGYMVVERISPYRLRLFMAHQAEFASGSARLTLQSHMVLNDIATMMKRHEDAKIIITGRSDAKGKGAMDRYLSEHRAEASIRYMEQHGVEAWRIERNSEGHVIHTMNEKRDASTIQHRLDLIITSQLLELKADMNLQESTVHQFRSAKENDLIVKRAGPYTLKLVMAHRAAFSPGSVRLTRQGSAVMNDLAGLLKRHPYANVEIVAHANDRDSPEENRRLSSQRARAVAGYLQQGGIEAGRVQGRGMGKTVYDVAGKPAQDAYRRVEIIIVNRLLNLVKYVDQQEEEAVRFQSAIRDDLVVRRPTLTRLDLIMAHQAAFTPGSAELRPAGEMALKEVAAMLKHYRQSTIQVIGHAGKKAPSIADGKLSGLRARIVANFLKARGIADVRINSKGVGAILYAPISKNDTDTFQRVEIMIEAQHGI